MKTIIHLIQKNTTQVINLKVILVVFAVVFPVLFGSGLNAQTTIQPVDSVHTVVDRAPLFKGKPSNIKRFIQGQLFYPDEAWRNGVEGVVHISGIVSKSGTLLNLSVEKSVDALLDMEALRVVELLTDWRPAKRDGEDVHSKVLIPVEFSLSPDERDFVSNLKKFGLNENPPLYILDDKIVQARIHLPSYNVKSIRVLKGDVAIEKYGEEAKNGAVIISTKRGTPPVR